MVEQVVSVGNIPESKAPPSDGWPGVAQLQRVVKACPRPFVLINERELSVLRRGLRKDGWKRTLYLRPAEESQHALSGAGLLSFANKWLDRRIVIPDSRDENNCCKRHCELAAAALSTAIIHGIERDGACADKAAEILLEYADAYSDQGSVGTPRMFEDSASEAVWAISLAQAYDLIYYSKSIGDEDKEQIEDGLLRIAAGRFSDWSVTGSAGAARVAAAGVIGLSIRDAAIIGFALDGFRRWMTQLDDGLLSGSPLSSHFDALSALVHLAEACYRAGINLYGFEAGTGKSLKAMFAAPLDYAYPSFRLPAVGDAPWDSFLPLNLYEIAYRRWSEPLFAWVLKRGYTFGAAPINHDQRENAHQFLRASFYAFLFGRDLPGRCAPPPLGSRESASLGMGCLRNDDAMMTVNCGPNEARSHLDKLGFTLYANDELLVPDFGSPGHGSPKDDWRRHTCSHNTILVDGRSQDPAVHCDVKLSCFGSSFQGIMCEAADCYSGVTHTRRMAMIGNICIISDTITSEEEHQYDWIMRCEGDPALMGDYKPAEVVLGEQYAATDARAYQISGELRVDWSCTNGPLGMSMWINPGGGQVMFGKCPAETAEKNAAFLICRQRCREAGFLAVMVPARPGESARLSREGSVIIAETPDSMGYIRVRSLGESAGDVIRSDGDIATVRISDGEIHTATVERGSWLVWENQPLIECPQGAQCVEVVFDERTPRISYRGEATGTLKLKAGIRTARINGVCCTGSNSGGIAVFRITPQMIVPNEAPPGI
ncbi:MAG: heparinase II/III family protein [Armatimonadetes bacterium]|nr:heparinase II/III family protein [Armatimonadota bacterium]